MRASRSKIERFAFDPRVDSAGSAPTPLRQATARATAGAGPAAAPNVRQYLCHLNAAIKDMTRAETRGAVVGVTPIEVERIGRAVARLRGRYLARVVDIGGANRQQPVSEGEIAQLRRAREWYEEAAAGLEALKTAIEAGEAALDGVRSD
ncbi:MAG TPA: hypothetical protein VJJ77_08630 [Dongiaceae bacterium]|nr:hypothetical protein [Dongiaceae bacterium]